MKWISIKDKLPQNKEVVLIYIFSNKTIEMASINPPEFRGAFWFYPENNGWEKDEVTHWIPLPAPPE